MKNSTQLDYILRHCIPRGISNFRRAIIVWINFLRGEYSEYLGMETSDPTELFKIAQDHFWDLLEDDTLEKSTYDIVMERAYEVQTGKVELVPWEDCNDWDDWDDEE